MEKNNLRQDVRKIEEQICLVFVCLFFNLFDRAVKLGREGEKSLLYEANTESL